MGMRKEMRLRLALPIRVSAENVDGEPFEQYCTTVDVTVNGLRVEGLTRTFPRGAVIYVRYGAKSVPAQVMWTGEMGSKSQGHVGLRVIGGWKNLWGRTIPHIPGDGFPNSTYQREAKPDSKLRPSDDTVPALLAGRATDASRQDAKQEQRMHVSFLPRTGLLHRVLREPRLKLQLPVRAYGINKTGSSFIENTITANVSRNGAHLIGLTCEVRNDEVLILSHQDRKSRFRVVWSRKHDTRPVFEIGLRALALAQSIWAIDFSGRTDECESAEHRVAQRYICSGGVSIWHPGAKYLVSRTVTDLSLDGCYVKVVTPLNVHDRVVLMLNINGIEVRTAAEVRISHPGTGIGLKFTDMAETDRSTLQALISRLGYSGSGLIDVRTEGRSIEEVAESVDEKETLQREHEKRRNGYHSNP